VRPARRPDVGAQGLAPRGSAGRRGPGAAARAPARVLSDLGEPDPGERPVRWGLGDVAVGLVPFALIGLTLLAGGGADDGDETEITIGALVANSLLLWVFLIGVPVVAAKLKGRGLVRDLRLRFAPVDAGAFVVGVLVQAVVIPALYVPVFWLSDVDADDVADEARELVDAASGPGIAVLVLIVCVGAPFAEELFFRGLMLRAVERRWGIGVALVATTVVFAVSHFQGIQFPALVVFGAVAGYLAVRTGRLGTAILCHAGFNAWTVFNLLVLDST
jgi:membrane protease YdiL (CAAX protease family)